MIVYHLVRNPPLGGDELDHCRRFFARLKVGDVFTYSDAYLFVEVAQLAKKCGRFILYCRPDSDEYKAHGCFTCKVVGMVPVENWVVIKTDRLTDAYHAIMQGSVKPGCVIIIEDIEKVGRTDLDRVLDELFSKKGEPK
jgi:hypothetical protein